MKPRNFCAMFIFAAMTAATQANTDILKIYSSFPVGSGPDTLARTVADVMERTHDIKVVIENRPGGNGAVAMAESSRQTDPNSYILFASNDNLITWPMMNKDFTLVSNFKPLTLALETELMLITGPDIKDIKQLNALVNPSYGSWGLGSASHILGADLSRHLGIKDSVHVPYKQYNQWFVDVSNGAVPYSFATVGSTRSWQQSGSLRYMAVVSRVRNPAYPEVPTLQELTGLSTYTFAWAAYYVPKDMSESRKQQLYQALRSAYQDTKVKNILKTLDYDYQDFEPTQFNKFINSEETAAKKSIELYNIKLK